MHTLYMRADQGERASGEKEIKDARERGYAWWSQVIQEMGGSEIKGTGGENSHGKKEVFSSETGKEEEGM